jgi:hypothetical protein
LARALAVHQVPLVGIVYSEDKLNPTLSRLNCLNRLFDYSEHKDSVTQFSGVFALFTDEFSHPLHIHICSDFSRGRNLPCLAFDSNRLLLHVASELSEQAFADQCEETISALAIQDWSEFVDVQKLKQIQRALQFQLHGEVFLPSVFSSHALGSVTILDWNQVSLVLGEVVSQDEEQHVHDGDDSCPAMSLSKYYVDLSTVVQEFDLLMTACIDTTKGLTRHQQDWILFVLHAGILSPLRLSRAIVSRTNSLAPVTDAWCHGERAILRFTARMNQLPSLVIKDVTTNNVHIDWFRCIDERCAENLIEEHGPLSYCRVRNASLVFEPNAFRTCSTNIDAFDYLQHCLISSEPLSRVASFVFRRFEFQYWLLTLCFCLPTVEYALEISVKEISTYGHLPVNDFVIGIALYLQALEDLSELIDRSRTCDSDGPALLETYNSLQESIRQSIP